MHRGFSFDANDSLLCLSMCEHRGNSCAWVKFNWVSVTANGTWAVRPSFVSFSVTTWHDASGVLLQICGLRSQRGTRPARGRAQAFLLGSQKGYNGPCAPNYEKALCWSACDLVDPECCPVRDPRFHARGVEDCRVRASSGRASSLELEHRFSAGASSTLVQRAKVTRGSVNEHECRVLYWQSIVDQWPAFLASISVRWVSPSERCLLGEGLSLVVPATMCSSPFSRGTC